MTSLSPRPLKDYKTHAEQIALLRQRGMVINDLAQFIETSFHHLPSRSLAEMGFPAEWKTRHPWSSAEPADPEAPRMRSLPYRSGQRMTVLLDAAGSRDH